MATDTERETEVEERTSDGEAGATGADSGDMSDREAELVAEREVLRTENERLRREYRRATRVTYRKSALALFGLGVLALVGAAAFPTVADVFIALGGIGCFGGVLTYYLAPERVLTASVGQHVFDAVRSNTSRLVDELGLQETAVFVPRDDAVRVFRPQHPAFELPGETDRLFVVADDPREQGVALDTAGTGLFEEFERGLAGPFADDVTAAADQLAEAVVEQFELAGHVAPDPEPADGRIVFGVSDPAITPLDAVEHPIPAFLGTGVAGFRAEPVEVTVQTGDDRFDAVVGIEWTD